MRSHRDMLTPNMDGQINPPEPDTAAFDDWKARYLHPTNLAEVYFCGECPGDDVLNLLHGDDAWIHFAAKHSGGEE